MVSQGKFWTLSLISWIFWRVKCGVKKNYLDWFLPKLGPVKMFKVYNKRLEKRSRMLLSYFCCWHWTCICQLRGDTCVFSENFRKVKRKNTRKRYEICSLLTLKTPEQCQWRCSSVFIANFEHVSHFFLFLLLSLSIYLFAGLRGQFIKPWNFHVALNHKAISITSGREVIQRPFPYLVPCVILHIELSLNVITYCAIWINERLNPCTQEFV